MYKQINILSIKLLFIAVILCSGISSCSSDNNNVPEGKVYFKNNEPPYDSNGVFLVIETSKKWSIDIEYPENQTPWCSLSESSGNGTQVIWISFTGHTDNESRLANFNVTLDNKTLQVSLKQLSREDVPVAKAGYLELPAIEASTDYLFVTHHFDYKGTQLRNYSILYDTKLHYPIWVAYPMHTVYRGSAQRTDDWQFDPLIPNDQQPVLFRGMGNGMDRGHMIPSASRTVSKEANAQTFFFTNMTAQMNSFNAQKWARTEAKVRDWQGTGQDTLYVVTGAVLQTVSGNESIEYRTNRNDGKKLPIPNYYYKVLLKKSINNNTVQYKTLGLWFNHEAASGNPELGDVKTVDWIEEQTGLDFFESLDLEIQNKVEQEYNPSAWGIR